MRKQMRRHMKGKRRDERKKEMEGKGIINIPYLSVLNQIPTKKKEEDDITATI